MDRHGSVQHNYHFVKDSEHRTIAGLPPVRGTLGCASGMLNLLTCVQSHGRASAELLSCRKMVYRVVSSVSLLAILLFSCSVRSAHNAPSSRVPETAAPSTPPPMPSSPPPPMKFWPDERNHRPEAASRRSRKALRSREADTRLCHSRNERGQRAAERYAARAAPKPSDCFPRASTSTPS